MRRRSSRDRGERTSRAFRRAIRSAQTPRGARSPRARIAPRIVEIAPVVVVAPFPSFARSPSTNRVPPAPPRNVGELASCPQGFRACGLPPPLDRRRVSSSCGLRDVRALTPLDRRRARLQGRERVVEAVRPPPHRAACRAACRSAPPSPSLLNVPAGGTERSPQPSRAPPRTSPLYGEFGVRMSLRRRGSPMCVAGWANCFAASFASPARLGRFCLPLVLRCAVHAPASSPPSLAEERRGTVQSSSVARNGGVCHGASLHPKYPFPRPFPGWSAVTARAES